MYSTLELFLYLTTLFRVALVHSRLFWLVTACSGLFCFYKLWLYRMFELANFSKMNFSSLLSQSRASIITKWGSANVLQSKTSGIKCREGITKGAGITKWRNYYKVGQYNPPGGRICTLIILKKFNFCYN